MSRKWKQYGLCFSMLFGLLQAGFAHAAMLSFDPAGSTAVETGSFDVDLIISGLETDELVGGFDITVGFDASLSTATNVAFSGNLGSTAPFDGETLNFVTPGSGLVGAFELSFLSTPELQALQPDTAFRLATFSFLAGSVGTAIIYISSYTISDDLGDEILIDDLGSARIDIAPVPLPGAFWLLAPVLLGIGAVARRRGSVK